MYQWIANHLPVEICYFCFIRVMAYATTGAYSDTIVPELEGMEALKRFEKGYNI